MSLIHRLSFALLAAGATAWSAPILRAESTAPTGVDAGAGKPLVWRLAPAPDWADSVGVVSSGYRSMHFNDGLGAFCAPRTFVPVDGDAVQPALLFAGLSLVSCGTRQLSLE